MKPFDLEKAKDGHPVCTRDGQDVRIVSFEGIDTRPVIGLMDTKDYGEIIHSWKNNGHISIDNSDHDYDLLMKEKMYFAFFCEDSTYLEGPIFRSLELICEHKRNYSVYNCCKIAKVSIVEIIEEAIEEK